MRLYSFLERFKSLFVSISDEKPLHMRLHFLLIFPLYSLRFNLRREAAPHATSLVDSLLSSFLNVSISDEKPLHMRRNLFIKVTRALTCFNLRREAAPHATSHFCKLYN